MQSRTRAGSQDLQRELPIVCDDRRAFDLRLSDEHAIERIRDDAAEASRLASPTPR